MARQRKPPPPRGPQLGLAGELCVAFVNTAGARPENRQQGVSSFAELVIWSREVGIVSAQEAERLRQLAAERPAEAEVAFERAATIRAGLARSFVASQLQKPAPEGYLEAFNHAVAESSLTLRLVAADAGAAWGWAGGGDVLDGLLSPILSSAVEVMVAAGGRPHVRQCAAKGCRLFFVDRSPSGYRRWCESKTCGHRTANLRYWHRRGKKERV
ncbi:MAG: CGNR zinc finger domain-containing protein [bacterium]|nr:CGNR zinc finger domain-containing protein [bacterium]